MPIYGHWIKSEKTCKNHEKVKNEVEKIFLKLFVAMLDSKGPQTFVFGPTSKKPKNAKIAFFDFSRFFGPIMAYCQKWVFPKNEIFWKNHAKFTFCAQKSRFLPLFEVKNAIFAFSVRPRLWAFLAKNCVFGVFYYF